MKLIIGLGNIGEKYAGTRHNVGWMALDQLDAALGKSGLRKNFAQSEAIEYIDGPNKFLLVYPQTFMNNSGQAVSELVRFFKLSPADLLVVHDEVDLPLGTIRIAENSGPAGHNGVSSVIDALGTQEFRRIRIGIESRENKNIPPTDAFVLQNFTPEQLEKIPFEEIIANAKAFLKI